MPTTLHMRSEVPPLSWDAFAETHPAGSIALDGYVIGPPEYMSAGPFANFNHHEGVDRLATLSTAQQLLKAIRMGLDKAFEKDGEFEAQAYANDCDEDVCAADFLLTNVALARKVTNPFLNRFVEVAGTLDVTAGAFPYDKGLQLLSELDWVFEPYHLFRASGEMAKKDNAQYTDVVRSVGYRIDRHIHGEGGQVATDPRYNRVSGGTSWAMIEPVGKNAAVGAFRDGLEAFITVQQIDDSTWRYGLRRRSKFIPVDQDGLYDELNRLEGCTDDQWGGADNAGGSPRVQGSKLSPSVVETAFKKYSSLG